MDESSSSSVIRRYCELRKQSENLRDSTAEERGELKRVLSDCRLILLQYLDIEAMDCIHFGDQMAIKRCVCISAGRLNAEKVVDSLHHVYNWNVLQPLVACGTPVVEAVRQKLKEQLRITTQQSKQYGDLVPIGSTKFKSRCSVDKASRRECYRVLPDNIHQVCDALANAKTALETLASKQKAELAASNNECDKLEPIVIAALKAAREGGKADSYYSFESTNPGEHTNPVNLRYVSYENKTKKPVLSVAKVDYTVGSDIQAFFSARFGSIATANKGGELPPMDWPALDQLVRSSIHAFEQEGTQTKEQVVLRKKRTRKDDVA